MILSVTSPFSKVGVQNKIFSEPLTSVSSKIDFSNDEAKLALSQILQKFDTSLVQAQK